MVRAVGTCGVYSDGNLIVTVDNSVSGTAATVTTVLVAFLLQLLLMILSVLPLTFLLVVFPL